MTTENTQASIRYHHHGISVSTGAVESVLQDIRDGMTYPDFWNNRYGEQDKQTSEYQRSWEVEVESAQA